MARGAPPVQKTRKDLLSHQRASHSSLSDACVTDFIKHRAFLSAAEVPVCSGLVNLCGGKCRWWTPRQEICCRLAGVDTPGQGTLPRVLAVVNMAVEICFYESQGHGC